jgi:NitT/TauT family transport system substrate-binding protein
LLVSTKEELVQSRRAGLVPLAALIAAMTLMATGCGDEESPPAAAEPAAESEAAAGGGGEPGPAEDTEIKVAIPFPDVTMYSMYVVASDLGYYEEEGLEVEVINADDVNAAVASGSADIGVQGAGGAIEAIRKGLDVDIIAGRGCRQTFSFAVQPDVKTVEDLDGTDVALAGTAGDPAEIARKQILKEEGWDLDSVDVKVVYPGPDSATWRQFFLADRIALMPFFGDDRPALEEYGANIVVEAIRNWPNDVHTANSEWLEKNPNTAVRFLRATMKGIDFIVAPGVGEIPENKDKVLEIYRAHDFDTADLEANKGPWGLDAQVRCENLYYDEAAWNQSIESDDLEPLEFDAELSYLEQAQELLGRDNAPPAEIEFP